jgi:hypothetical protein
LDVGGGFAKQCINKYSPKLYVHVPVPTNIQIVLCLTNDFYKISQIFELFLLAVLLMEFFPTFSFSDSLYFLFFSRDSNAFFMGALTGEAWKRRAAQ